MSASRNKAIESAEGVALFRALGALEPRDAFRNPDFLARDFLGPRYRRTYHLMKLFRRFSLRRAERAMPGSYWYLFVRTRHLDEILLETVAEGIEQLVILGAGYDSRIYRFRDSLRQVACFEVDHPATQAAKRRHLRRRFPELPSNLTLVPIDFNRERLEPVLAESGYQEDKKTLFIWEGVCLYLPDSSVDAVFETVRGHAAPGSSIAFDYVTRAVVDGQDSPTLGAAETRQGTTGLGEPILFGIDPAKTEHFLAERGFELLSDLSSEALSERYLREGDGSAVGEILGFTHIAHARMLG